KAKTAFEFRKVFKALNVIKLIEFNNDQEDLSSKEDLMKTENRTFVKGWGYRNKELTKQDRNYYKELFYPNFHQKSKSLIDPEKINIAIHIRRGDYVQWEGGRYFFNDAIYTKAIDKLIELIGTDCRVLIFTNDKNLNRHLYDSKYSNCYISSSDERTDHYLMSQCQYIIGPPSSFSMWASYIGNTKFYHLKGENDKIKLENFEICNG
ncbi:MAG: alpha-1,2-fucosyltransferase, partial [Bacteroidia bacterium]